MDVMVVAVVDEFGSQALCARLAIINWEALQGFPPLCVCVCVCVCCYRLCDYNRIISLFSTKNLLSSLPFPSLWRPMMRMRHG